MEKVELLICSAFFLLMQSTPTAPVTVTTKQPLVEVHENESAVLSCEFQTQADPTPRIEWKKRTETSVHFIYFRKEFLEDLVGRATIEGATITIQKVTQMDAAVYHCEVSASQDTVSLGETNVTLRVLVPPNTPSCEVPSSALTGTRVTLRCWDRQSVPPATYSWFKDNKLLSVNRASNTTYALDPRAGTLVRNTPHTHTHTHTHLKFLMVSHFQHLTDISYAVVSLCVEQEFNPISRADSGRYHCEASNGVGVPKSCKGNHIHIDDVDVSAVVVGVVLVTLLLALCSLVGCYTYRQGYLSQGRRGRSFWISQCHGVTQISSQNLHGADDTNTSYVSSATDVSAPPAVACVCVYNRERERESHSTTHLNILSAHYTIKGNMYFCFTPIELRDPFRS
ncbi:junctional adhesion molecule B-like [Scleropages formosus]|uniref:junctional adhesion molecule B-like n=1 Tax=Scleropages formosus TaxID=113540 RepID=UPI0010FAC102|nr:junctional adhesion molecule B-like [Scleropages formosus]